jgi:hypothetical protein
MREQGAKAVARALGGERDSAHRLVHLQEVLDLVADIDEDGVALPPNLPFDEAQVHLRPGCAYGAADAAGVEAVQTHVLHTNRRQSP